MIYLLYGEDVFSSSQKIEAIQKRFLEKHPSENLTTKNSDEVSIDSLENILYAQTLLGGQRLIVFKNLLSDGSADLKNKLLNILKENEIVDINIFFHETQSFDKRQALFKFLKKTGQSQEFVNLLGFNLSHKVNEMAQNYNLDLSKESINFLIASNASDLLAIDSDLKKLAAFSLDRELDLKNMQALIGSNLTLNVFDALKAWTENRTGDFLNIINQQLDQGEDIVKVVGALTYQLRTAVQVKSLLNSTSNTRLIVQKTKLHPFAIQQSLKLVKDIEAVCLNDLYELLAEVDYKLKTGACAPEDISSILAASRISSY